ncbi:hypothetical protein QP450_07045, partial [Gardnerella vaginalis]|uniref:hypothetical protein n=1 Tax=Gardnerella vaginalis TaxID=2702 RepID=UPI00254E5DA4
MKIKRVISQNKRFKENKKARRVDAPSSIYLQALNNHSTITVPSKNSTANYPQQSTHKISITRIHCEKRKLSKTVKTSNAILQENLRQKSKKTTTVESKIIEVSALKKYAARSPITLNVLFNLVTHLANSSTHTSKHRSSQSSQS